MNPFEFGHKYMPVQWQDRMFRFGLFNYHFLSRNLAAALVLLPRIMTHYPYVRVSQHGVSLLDDREPHRLVAVGSLADHRNVRQHPERRSE